jgi:DNA polymerase-3 subunit chi
MFRSIFNNVTPKHRNTETYMEISFYHLSVTPLEKAVPALVERAYDAGLRTHVLCDADKKQALDNALWTYHPRKFLPHGTDDDTKIPAARQPILLSDEQTNLNSAKVLAITNGTEIADFGDFERALDIFDGNIEAGLAAARKRWKTYKDRGLNLRYWFQDEKGKWLEKSA